MLSIIIQCRIFIVMLTVVRLIVTMLGVVILNEGAVASNSSAVSVSYECKNIYKIITWTDNL